MKMKGMAYTLSGGSYVVKSNDKSKILVFTNEYAKEYDKEAFYINVFDESLKLLWSKRVELKYEEWQYNLKDFTIDNSGNVYLLGKVFLSDKEKNVIRGMGVNFTYNISRVSSGDSIFIIRYTWLPNLVVCFIVDNWVGRHYILLGLTFKGF